MFLNFLLGAELLPYAGVDVTYMRSDPEDREEWECHRVQSWERWVQN